MSCGTAMTHPGPSPATDPGSVGVHDHLLRRAPDLPGRQLGDAPSEDPHREGRAPRHAAHPRHVGSPVIEAAA
jgi:hypothetical protein